jgi:hypothetical protein
LHLLHQTTYVLTSMSVLLLLLLRFLCCSLA